MNLRSYTGAFLFACAALLLTACGATSVNVDGRYPTPNISAMPLTLGVYYDEAFREHQYIEVSDRGSDEYLVNSGQSHIELFNTILPAMFQQVVQMDSPTADAGVDAVFIPSIDEFQLAIPAKTRLDSFEVWVRYNLRLATPQGGTIADWVLTAYGKVPDETFRSTERGINDATVAALRDLGSNFTLSFTAVPEVRDWLRLQQQSTALN